MKQNFSVLACGTCFVLLLSILFLVPSPVVHASPAYEDFTDPSWIEVEPDDRIQKTANHVDHLAYRNEDSYLYKDKGVNHFTDFEHLVDVRSDFASSLGTGIIWMLANDLDDFYFLYVNSKDFIGIRFYRASPYPYYRIKLCECDSGILYETEWKDGAINTWYYLKIKKVGIDLSCEIYSDSERTTIITTLNLTLHKDHHFRYIYACNSFHDGYSQFFNDDIENLNLQEEYYITFYNNTGGILRVDNATITNGTQIVYEDQTLLELSGIPQNSSYVFLNFTWTNGNSTTNPCNYTVTSNMTIWCYFGSAGRSAAWVLAAGAILTLVLVPAAVLFWRKR